MNQNKPLQLFYWPTPNGWKITILLEELQAPYEITYVNINRGEQFDPAFLAISPNNRMPALTDPEGPGGGPLSVFESAAIMMYVARKFGKFYPVDDERARVEVEQWLMWQMGGFGPMLGQNHHFRNYAPEHIPYAVKRYEDEAHRLYRILDKRLEDREFVAGDYSIADMAIMPWARSPERQGIDLSEFPHLSRWREALLARPAVAKAVRIGEEKRSNLKDDAEAQKVLFGQR